MSRNKDSFSIHLAGPRAVGLRISVGGVVTNADLTTLDRRSRGRIVAGLWSWWPDRANSNPRFG